MDFSWMAWTWPTVGFFGFIACCLVAMTVWEWKDPGGGQRRGIFAFNTTRGDRLFISLLGSAFIFLGWLSILGTPMWGGLAISILWTLFTFRYV